MDKTALDVIRETAKASLIAYYEETTAGLARAISEDVVAALGANGYVVVPEPLLKELLDAAADVHTRRDVFSFARLFDARAAVVEAGGPTT